MTEKKSWIPEKSKSENHSSKATSLKASRNLPNGRYNITLVVAPELMEAYLQYLSLPQFANGIAKPLSLDEWKRERNRLQNRAVISKDTRTDLQRKEAAQKAPAEYNRRRLAEAEDKTMQLLDNTVGKPLNFVMPSQLSRGVYDLLSGNNNFFSSVWNGNEGLGNPYANFAFDVVSPFAYGKVARGVKSMASAGRRLIPRVGLSRDAAGAWDGWVTVGGYQYRPATPSAGYFGVNPLNVERRPLIDQEGWVSVPRIRRELRERGIDLDPQQIIDGAEAYGVQNGIRTVVDNSWSIPQSFEIPVLLGTRGELVTLLDAFNAKSGAAPLRIMEPNGWINLTRSARSARTVAQPTSQAAAALQVSSQPTASVLPTPSVVPVVQAVPVPPTVPASAVSAVPKEVLPVLNGMSEEEIRALPAELREYLVANPTELQNVQFNTATPGKWRDTEPIVINFRRTNPTTGQSERVKYTIPTNRRLKYEEVFDENGNFLPGISAYRDFRSAHPGSHGISRWYGSTQSASLLSLGYWDRPSIADIRGIMRENPPTISGFIDYPGFPDYSIDSAFSHMDLLERALKSGATVYPYPGTTGDYIYLNDLGQTNRYRLSDNFDQGLLEHLKTNKGRLDGLPYTVEKLSTPNGMDLVYLDLNGNEIGRLIHRSNLEIVDLLNARVRELNARYASQGLHIPESRINANGEIEHGIMPLIGLKKGGRVNNFKFNNKFARVIK